MPTADNHSWLHRNTIMLVFLRSSHKKSMHDLFCYSKNNLSNMVVEIAVVLVIEINIKVNRWMHCSSLIIVLQYNFSAMLYNVI